MDKKIKILHIGLTSNLGGIEKYVYNLCKNCDRRFFEFSIIDANEENIALKEDFIKCDVKLIKIYNRKKHYFKHLMQLKNIIKENEYKYIHFHLMDLSCFDRILLAMKFSNAKIILHSHIANYDKNIFRKFADWLGRILLNNKENIIKLACSNDAGRYMFKRFKDNKFTVLYNFIDTEKYGFNIDARNKIRKQLDVNNKIVLGHVGRFEKQKNHKFIIKIFREIYIKNKNICLVLVGDGKSKKRIERIVEKWELKDGIKFLGIRNDVNSLMQGMDLFLFPSLYEGLGIVLIEAQTSGLISFISSNLPNEIDVIKSSIYRIDLTKKPKEWANKILETKYLNYKQRVDCLKKMDKSNYNVENAIKEVEKIYFS